LRRGIQKTKRRSGENKTGLSYKEFKLRLAVPNRNKRDKHARWSNRCKHKRKPDAEKTRQCNGRTSSH
jgi:hypothetical protein